MTKPRFIPLGNIAEFINGYPFAPDDWHDEGLPIIRIQNLTDDRKPFNRSQTAIPEKYKVLPGELLVSWSASLGVFEWRGPEPGLVNQHIFRVNPRLDLTDPNYLRFALTIALEEMKRHLHGATMQHVNRGEFLATPIYLPPIGEQRRIAAILDQADALRTKRRAALAQLDEMAQAIFVNMFGDPSFNARNWPIEPLSDLICSGDTINYGVIQPGDYFSGGVPLVRVGDLVDGRVRHTELKRIDPAIDAHYKRSKLRGDEILVSCVGSIGVIALTHKTEADFNIARAVARIRVGKTVMREFVAAYLRTAHVQHYFEKELRTVSQPTLNIKQLGETKVPVPPLSIQQAFVDRLAVLDGLRAQQVGSGVELETLFASLQHRAFTGAL